MKRPIALLNVVLGEILEQHGLLAKRDVDLVNRRHAEEGDSFLGISLPAFGSAIELGLEQGFITRRMFPSFKGRNQAGPLPAFLQGLVMKIFQLNGTLREDADPDAIYGIRQICYLLKKPKQICSEKRNRAAQRQYINTEEELNRYEEISCQEEKTLRGISDILWGSSIFHCASAESFQPRHGPGVTADKRSSNGRHQLRTWYQRHDESFPMDLYAIPNSGWYESLESINVLSKEQELPVKVIFVPKTVKTPRVIAVEPSHVQFLQQGVMRYLVEKLESHHLTRESVRFRDQSVNKREARACSLTRDRSTLDLSEASDRVSLTLVRNIFKNSPILEYLLGSRSSHATLDGGKTSVELRKFASMGSANCFPVLAMVSYTLIQCALHYYHREVPSHVSIRRFSRLIDVYGDDLIVPTYARGIVCSTLEAFGLRVNSKKSFSEGYFRESCGGDYYRGYDVTPVYLRHNYASWADLTPAVVKSLASASNQFYRKGLWRSCRALRELVSRAVRTSVPTSPYTGEGLVFYSCFLTSHCHYDYSINGYVQKRIVYSPSQVTDECSEMGSLNKFLLSRGNGASTGAVLSFDKSVKRGVFRTKHRWIGASIGHHDA